jgi:enterochelin esterase family protein
MRMPPLSVSVLGRVSLLSLLLSGACASTEGGHPSGTAGSTGTAGSSGSTGTAGASAGTTGAAGDTAGSTGTAGSSAAGAGGGLAGSTGTAGAGGAAGATATAGSSGAGGAAGAAGAAGSTSGGAATTGKQDDPGTMGDGTVVYNGPYTFAPEEMSLMNGAQKGTVTGPFMHTTTGTYTGWSKWVFTYYVFVPAEYQKGHAAALMIFNDGYLYGAVDGKLGTTNQDPNVKFNAPIVIENLIKEGSMPVTIGVFIFPGTNDGHQVGGGDGGRSVQYDSANDQYGKFLREEFLPTEILNKYDIVTDPDGWAMAGHSSGGIASVIAGWFHNDRWHKALTASPSFPNRGGMFPNLFKTKPAMPLRLYHTAGTQDLGGFRGANDSAAMILQMMGAPYHDRYLQTTDVHYPPHAAMMDFPNAMRWVWRGYHTPP